MTITGKLLTITLTFSGCCISQTLHTLYFFKGMPDGANPGAGLAVGRNGLLYGTTVNGGTNGCGTIFSMRPPAAPSGQWSESVLYNFAGGSDGCGPSGVVADSYGVLYGTTDGYSGSQCCTVSTAFSLTPPVSAGASWTLTVLHTFAGCPTDGGAPLFGLAIGRGGVLYGASFYGGAYSCIPQAGGAGLGTVFSLTPPAAAGGIWTESVYSIGTNPGLDGPGTGVSVGPGGVLYGATQYGGSYCCGAVFSLVPPPSPDGVWAQTIIQSFGNPTLSDDGAYPNTRVVIGKSGELYGTTVSGGLSNAGEVYELLPPSEPGGAWIYNVLYKPPAPPFRASDGPEQLTLGNDGVLYSAIFHGGDARSGTIFSLTPPSVPGGAWVETTLYTFSGRDGVSPNGGLVVGPDGLLFGTTYGYDAKLGTVFALKP